MSHNDTTNLPTIPVNCEGISGIVLSTAHLDLADRRTLETMFRNSSEELPSMWGWSNCGFYITAYPGILENPIFKKIKSLREPVEFALRHKFRLLVFDTDGDIVTEITTFDE